MKVLIAPDKFKGSLTAYEVCDAVEKGLLAANPDITVESLPLADGGEGTLDVLSKVLHLEPVIMQVRDPLFRPVMASYYKKGHMAFIEMAMASGLQLLTVEERNCMHTSSYGTGELMVDAIRNGATELFLFVGGSATNDAGIGMASALGYQFYDEFGDTVETRGKDLKRIHDFDLVDPQFTQEVKYHVITDVTNPFYGEKGAAHVYGPQKGASQEEVVELDEGLQNLNKVIKHKLGVDLQNIPGSGAAGGMGGGALSFLNAEIKNGIDTIIEMTGFEDQAATADLIITGEGKFDDQTLSGKVILGVSKMAKKYAKPLVVVCGVSEVSEGAYMDLGIEQVITLVDENISSKEAMEDAGNILVEKVKNLLKLEKGRH